MLEKGIICFEMLTQKQIFFYGHKPKMKAYFYNECRARSICMQTPAEWNTHTQTERTMHINMT